MTRYLSLAEYFYLAEQVTGLDIAALLKVGQVELANSALHAPAAGFGEEDFDPDLIDKAAVLTCRLAWNHPLPDGNKRAAWAACLVMFVDLNGGRWDPDLTRPMSMTARPSCLQSPGTTSMRSAWPGCESNFET